MHDAHRRHARHYRVIEVAVEFFQSLLHAPAAYIELHGYFGLVFVARQRDGWLALSCSLVPVLGCRLAFADALNIVYAHTEAHCSHLHLGFAAVRGQAKYIGILTKAQNAHRVPDLQRPGQLFRPGFRFFGLAARRWWGRDGRYLVFKAAHRFTRLAQTFASEVDAAYINFDLCQRALHLFEFALRLRASIIQYLDTLLFEFKAILLELLALILCLGVFHAQVEAFILQRFAFRLQPFEQ